MVVFVVSNRSLFFSPYTIIFLPIFFLLLPLIPFFPTKMYRRPHRPRTRSFKSRPTRPTAIARPARVVEGKSYASAVKAVRSVPTIAGIPFDIREKAEACVRVATTTTAVPAAVPAPIPPAVPIPAEAVMIDPTAFPPLVVLETSLSNHVASPTSSIAELLENVDIDPTVFVPGGSPLAMTDSPFPVGEVATPTDIVPPKPHILYPYIFKDPISYLEHLVEYRITSDTPSFVRQTVPTDFLASNLVGVEGSVIEHINKMVYLVQNDVNICDLSVNGLSPYNEDGAQVYVCSGTMDNVRAKHHLHIAILITSGIYQTLAMAEDECLWGEDPDKGTPGTHNDIYTATHPPDKIRDFDAAKRDLTTVFESQKALEGADVPALETNLRCEIDVAKHVIFDEGIQAFKNEIWGLADIHLRDVLRLFA